MSRKLISILSLVALLAAACSSGNGDSDLQTGKGKRFIPQVVDTQGDIGSSAWVSTSAEGNPVISYLGLPDRPAEGEIPETRTIDFPLTPAVLVAANDGGPWSLSAVEEQRDALVVDSENGSPEPAPHVSGQSAVAEDGTVHVVWVDSEGLQYARGTAGQFSEAATIAKGDEVFGPSITLDGDTPWVAFYDGTDVKVASAEDDWEVVDVAGTAGCAKDCAITRTAVAVGPGGPVVGYADRMPMYATMPTSTDAVSGWDSAPIEKVPGGTGMAMTTDAEGGVVASYVHADGGITVATVADKQVDVVAATEPSPSAWASTDVSVDDEGTRWVTWYDTTADSVRLASGSAGEYVTIDTPGTRAGAMPSVSAGSDGSTVWLAWYDHGNQNLMAGAYAEQEVEIAVREPEPVPAEPAPPAGGTDSEPTPAPAPDAEGGGEPAPEGGAGKAVTLTISAPVGAVADGFDETTLEAPADTPIVIEFDNQDSGVPHDVDIQSPDGGSVISDNEIITGPAQATYDIGPLSVGDYPFICSVHPTTMTGTLKVK